MTVDLHYTVDGPEDGPVLVLGSSLGTTGGLWQPQLAALAERHRVVRYDHRGHGASPQPVGPYTMDDLGGDVLALLDRLELAKASLGGISLGGMTAMWVAAHAPDRVDRLALLCTSARLGPPEMWAERAAAVRTGGMAAIADAVFARWLTPSFVERHNGVAAWVWRMLTSSPAEGYAACCEAIGGMDLFPVLGGVTAPTLVIAGAEDPATPAEHAERIAAAIPDARVEIVPDAAHLANVNAPEAVTDLLTRFLDG